MKPTTTPTLIVTGSEHLPVIIAQHLFTSFMWTVVERLPSHCLRNPEEDVDVLNPYNFDIRQFGNTWHLPTLRHRALSKMVQQMESYGLGRVSDILLCMIPALSFKDLLPNDRILTLIPQMSSGRSWVESARCHNELLKIGMGTHTEDRFAFSVVVRAIDFLYVAFEPYKQNNDRGKDDDLDDHNTLTSDLREELSNLVNTLASKRFKAVLRILVPVYELQKRRKELLNIFNRLHSYEEEEESKGLKSINTSFELEQNSVDEDFFERQGKNLDFTKLHINVCRHIFSGRDWIQEPSRLPVSVPLFYDGYGK